MYRLLLAVLLAAGPTVAHADPASILTAIGYILSTTSYAAYAAYFYYAAIAVTVIGTANQRRQARRDAANSRAAYNASLSDRSITALTSNPPFRAVYGRCIVGGDIVAILTSDKQGVRENGESYVKPDAMKHLVIHLASREVKAIHDVYIDGVALGVPDGDGWATTDDWAKVTPTSRVFFLPGTTGTFNAGSDMAGVISVMASGGFEHGGEVAAPYEVAEDGTITILPGHGGEALVINLLWSSEQTSSVRVSKHLGTTDQAADAYLRSVVGDKWSVDHRLRGRAYIVVTLDMDVETRFTGGPPNITADVSGHLIYDPRKDSTRGGSGAHRVDVPSTWEWTDNNALITADWLASPLGFEVDPIDDIVLEDTIAGANVCDTVIQLKVGDVIESGSMYTCNGAFSATDGKEAILEGLCESMAGVAVYGAAWSIIPGSWTPPVELPGGGGLTDVDLDGQIEIVQAGAPMDAIFNGVRGSYVPRGKATPIDFAPYQNPAFVSADGRELWSDLSLPYTDHPARCANIARIVTERARDALVIRYPAKLRAFPLRIGDRITVDSAEYGFAGKTFRVTDWQFSTSSPVMLVLQEDGPGAYDLVDAVSADPEPNTTLPDPYQVSALVVTEQPVSGDAHALISADGTVVPRVLVRWERSDDPYVVTGGEIHVSWRLAGSVEWVRSPPLPGGSTQIYLQGMLEDQAIVVELHARNSFRSSGPSVFLSHLVQGKNAPPSNVLGFASAIVPTGVRLSWTPAEDADYAATELHVEATWNDATAPLFDGRASTYTWPFPAAGTHKVWAKHRDASGNRSTTAALVTVVVGDSILIDESVLAASLNTRIDEIEPLRVDVDSTLAQLVDINVRRLPALQSDNRVLDDDLSRLAVALQRALLSIDATQTTMRDAGIVVDPASGQVTISAIERQALQISQVQIKLDAQTSTISLLATTAYVNQQIAAAVLDPSGLPVFTALDVRLTSAEVTIAGHTALIALKADAVTVSSQGARLTSAESDIDGLEAAIALRATSTALNAVDARVTSAELSIAALSDQATSVRQLQAASYQLTRDQAATGEAALGAVLAAYQAGEYAQTVQALFREEITAKVSGDISAEVQRRVELAARIAGAEARVSTEELVRASAVEALSSLIVGLTASLGAVDAALSQESLTRTSQVDALAALISTLQTVVDGNQASVQATLDTLSTSSLALARSTTTLHAQQIAADRAGADAAGAELAGVLLGYQADETAQRVVALAREELTASINAGVSAEASQRLELGAQMGASIAAAQQQISVLAAADAAEASARQALAAVVESNRSTAQSQVDVLTTTQGTQGFQISTLQSQVGAQGTTLATVQSTANTAATTSAANAIELTTVQARLGPAGDIGGTLASVQSTANAAASASSVNATAITGVQARLGPSGDVGSALAAVEDVASAAASAVDGLEAKRIIKTQVRTSDGKVVTAGIGLLASADGDVTQSEVVLMGKTITLVMGDDINDPLQTLMTTGTRNGVPTIIMRSGYIGDLAVDTLQIAGEAVTQVIVVQAESATVGAVKHVPDGYEWTSHVLQHTWTPTASGNLLVSVGGQLDYTTPAAGGEVSLYTSIQAGDWSDFARTNNYQRLASGATAWSGDIAKTRRIAVTAGVETTVRFCVAKFEGGAVAVLKNLEMRIEHIKR